MRYSIINLGCKVNRVESDAFERKLSALQGTQLVDLDADIVVINTCTVTAVAEKKTRKCVRRALKDHSNAQIIVTGCAATQSNEAYERMSERIIVADRFDVPALIDKLFEESSEDAAKTPCIEGHAATEPQSNSDDVSHLRANEHSRMGVKIQDGCNNNCSFCIVHTLRGRERSIPAQEVIEDCKRLTEAGIPEIVLTGINTGKYDSKGTDLTKLMSELLSLDLPSRFRISSIEPTDFDINLAKLAESSEGMLCRHFHIPFQSGCSKTLKEMNRLHDADFARELIEEIRNASPAASISTDMIVGFPGETDEDFQETMDFCKAMRFSKIHVFPYSMRARTPAAERSDQIDPDIKKHRAKALQKLANEMRAQDLASRAGNFEIIVVESEEDSLTESYHWVKTPTGAAPKSMLSIKL